MVAVKHDSRSHQLPLSWLGVIAKSTMPEKGLSTPTAKDKDINN
jgi:hypothetical protein